MRKFKVLCLTDHSGHSKENSLYAILGSLSTHDLCEYVDVASRGVKVNDGFFKSGQFDKLSLIRVDGSFDFDSTGEQFSKNASIVNTDKYDIIFMRLPRPVSDDFLFSLAEYFKEKTLINNPRGIVECSNKAFLLNFPDLCPPMKLCKSIDQVLAFSSSIDVVLKPLREYGGKGLLKITGDILNDGDKDHNTVEYLQSIKAEIEKDGYLAMKFLKNVKNGDKRLIVVGGDILAASLRLPPEDSWLCNVARGGRSVPAEATKEEIHIVRRISPLLSKHGILIYGVDTLEDDNGERILSEINALSIGGFPQAEIQTGKPIIKITLDKIFENALQKYN